MIIIIIIVKNTPCPLNGVTLLYTDQEERKLWKSDTVINNKTIYTRKLF